MQEQKAVLGVHFHLSDTVHSNLLIFLKHVIQSINEDYLNHLTYIIYYFYDKTNFL